MNDLNENQLAAARHGAGSMMVLAGPGSGKTAVIVARAAMLRERLLVITYSKAAAKEMERRYEILVRGNDSAKSNVMFGTFHSAFFRMLRRKNGYDTGQILSDNERRMAVRGFLAEMRYEPDDEMLAALLSEMSLVRNELYDLKHYHSKSIGTEDFIFLCNSYEAHKKEKNIIDFDDMLCRTHEMLHNNPSELNYWCEKYPFIMIDEFQDINRVQYETVKLLAAPKNNLFIVGDDDQSIYRFRGSRPEFLLNFPKDFPKTKKVTLERNYRSTDSIINYANKVIEKNIARYDKNISGTGLQGKPPINIISEDQNHEAVQIAERIRDLRGRGANLDEIAIAFRLNIQARAFMDAFLNMHIPYKSRDEMPTIYEHWLARDLFAFMRVARRLSLRQKTGYDPDAARIINKPYRFIGKAFLHSVKKFDRDIFSAYKKDSALHIATKTHIEELHDNLLLLAKHETSDAIRYIRKNMGYNGHVIDACEYKKLSPTGLFEIADELQEAAKLFANPMDFIAHANTVSQAAKQQEKTGECVTLTTLHSAKGLEFERVFIAGIVEEVLPYIRSKTAAEIEEERRLFYVGVTRAKKELYLSTIKTRYEKPVKPSRFLE
ncbi:MAG: ATP-dependent helicase [Clostridiales bacterium]|jgi:DNA helicase-2/ATP-dependent DNA helicase PcrA|nr:ATP-dependent helicase [Clostridiales bacterium]